jgi:hypothetical protein
MGAGGRPPLRRREQLARIIWVVWTRDVEFTTSPPVASAAKRPRG